MGAVNLAFAPEAGPDPEPTMSRREIAELVGVRHGDVRKSMETLAEKGIINLTEKSLYSTGRRGRPGYEYHVNKGDSYVIVARLSPKFIVGLSS